MRKLMLAGGVLLALIFGVVGFATADSVSYPGVVVAPGSQEASGTVTVTASANPKLTLTITTPDPGQTVAFGAQDPMSGATANVTVGVKSNKAYDLDTTLAGDFTLMGLTTSVGDLLAEPKGDTAYNDVYTLNIPWTTDGATALSATVVYTVTQN